MDAETETAEQATTFNGNKIIRRTRREVLCKLTHAEEHAYGQKLAKEERAWDVLEAKRKNVAAEFKGDLSKISTEIGRLTAALNSHEELRSTEVLDVLDGSQVKTYRADTHELIDQRPASYGDTQEDLFPEPDGDEAPEELGEIAEPEVTAAEPYNGDPADHLRVPPHVVAAERAAHVSRVRERLDARGEFVHGPEPVGEMATSAVGDAVFIGGDGEEVEADEKPRKARKAKARRK